jgi:hypothetical protein
MGSFLSQWEDDRERASFFALAQHFDVTAVRFNGVFDDGQSDSAAGYLLSGCRFRPVKLLEDA